MESLGIWASFVGLAIAIYQIWRTGRIVLATRRGAEYTTARLAEYAVHAQYAELLELQADLDHAITNDDRAVARTLLQHWDRRAFELIGMSPAAGVSTTDVRTSALAAREAAEKIKKSHKTALGTVASTAEAKIGAVCSSVRQASGELRVQQPLDLTATSPSVLEDLRDLYWRERKTKKIGSDEGA